MLAFKTVRQFTAALAAVVACTTAAHAQTLDDLYEKAKQEKSLVFYAGGPAAPHEARAAEFQRRFPGIGGQVETVDVPTQLTWERFMGGTHGFANFPAKKASIWSGLKGSGGDMTLPGLEGFYFAGVWASMAGSLFGNALSGRRAIQAICGKAGKPFRSA